tara:strand:+ start:1955 stop:2248 length:294 start_codon:yes stop_codon:yes gene_type:complete
MARFKTVGTPNGQTNVEIVGDELAALEAAEQAYADGATARAWAALRLHRNELLAECDWWSFADSPAMTDEQKAYRQALRDLPANTSDAANPSWPDKP